MKHRASRRVVLRLAAGMAGAAFLPIFPAWAADPATLVQDVSTEVIELIKTQTGTAREVGIRKILEQSFDLPFMARSALATHWEGTNEELRARFLKAVVASEAKAYSERFGQYGGQTLTVGRVSQRSNGSTVVDSRLSQTGGQPIKIEWELRGERVTDVKIEGVSMVMTRRSDFNSYIQNNGGKVEALVEQLESRAKAQ